MTDHELTILDGSFGEGGGQIIRNGISLACILKRKIKIQKIRANRPNPGLASQHLESILALSRLSGVTISPQRLQKGMTEFELDPTGTELPQGLIQKLSTTGQDFLETEIDLKTAGSITLCVQGILPYLLSISSTTFRSQITIIGGTHVMKAPNMDYFCRVFLPLLQRIGYKVDAETLRPGYFPRGGGRVLLRSHSGTNGQFHPFSFTERGRLLEKSAILSLTPPLDQHRQIYFDKMKLIDNKNIELKRVSYAAIEYFLKYENVTIGVNRLLQGKPPKPTRQELLDGIQIVEDEATQFMETPGACLDSYLQDQLIIYMTLSKLQNPNTISQFTTLGPLTDHTTSAIHVSELLTGLKFNIEELTGRVVHVSL